VGWPARRSPAARARAAVAGSQSGRGGLSRTPRARAGRA
jgi:hypothetical protein